MNLQDNQFESQSMIETEDVTNVTLDDKTRARVRKRPQIVNDLSFKKSRQSAGQGNYKLRYQDHEEIEVNTHLDTSMLDRTQNQSQTMANMLGTEAEDDYYSQYREEAT